MFSGEAVVSPFCLILQLILGVSLAVMQSNSDIGDLMPSTRGLGFYVCPGKVVYDTLSGLPSGMTTTAFILESFKAFGEALGYSTQKITQTDKIWIRGYITASGGWQPWKLVTTATV